MSVHVCVTKVGVAVMDLRVVCKIIMCVSAFTELENHGHVLRYIGPAMIFLIFLEIVKTAADLDTLR